MPRKDLTGKTFGRLTVLEFSHADSSRKTYWKCKCSCGVVSPIRTNNLLTGRSTSCGCKRTEVIKKVSQCDKTGKNNPNWKGGVLSEYEKERHSDKNTIWRNAVFKKDSYKCKKCGDTKGGNLNAHHIKNFKDNPGLRFSVKNGCTLCKTCHTKFHVKFGYHNNTPSQLKIFLNS